VGTSPAVDVEGNAHGARPGHRRRLGGRHGCGRRPDHRLRSPWLVALGPAARIADIYDIYDIYDSLVRHHFVDQS
jgi:hypothetical protein